MNESSQLRVLLLNVRSLRNKISELVQLTTLYGPDVVCINETWLDETVSDQEVALSGYGVVRKEAVS